MLGLSYNANSKITELLLKHNSDPNIKNNDGDSMLCWACYYGNSKVVELLLKYGADPATNNNAALHWAFNYMYNEIIELLLQYHADPNAVLNRACESGDVEIIALLLKYGADPKGKVDGKSPVESIGQRNRGKIINLLAQYSGVEKHYLRNRAIEALICCCFAACFTVLGIMHSPWCFISAATFVVFTYLSIASAIKDSCFIEKKEPSPEFAEVIAERADELDARSNSQESGNALT